MRKLAKEIKNKERFDLFFCLPDSFSSALIGWATGAKKRIGHKKELRNILLTNAFEKEKGLHRVEEYLSLLQCFNGKKPAAAKVLLQHSFSKGDYVVININSEAQSRRLTVSKAVEEIDTIKNIITHPIYLIGAPKERAFVDEVYNSLKSKGITNLSGKTALPQLIEILASAQLMLTTDSGPAHLANALGTPTIVLFGAGNEANTAPYNKDWNTVIRLGQLSCEPCLKNKCVRYEVPQCLQQLDASFIARKVSSQLENSSHG